MQSENPVLGRVRAYWLATVVCMGGFLFGYDSGIIGGVLTLSSFEKSFRYGSSSATKTTSLAVSLQQAGAFVACLLVWPITKRIGRKKTLAISSFIFCIGAIIQTIDTHSRAAFYVARVIAGVGLGAATVVIPMYNSEMAPKELRAQVGSFFQLFFTIGIMISYWCVYGVSKGISPSARQWQIPVGLQIAPAALLGLGMLTLKESTRWLTQQNRHSEALESLIWIRASDSPRVHAEMEEIRVGVELEARATEGFSLRELLEPNYFKRIWTAFWVFTAQQSTGATAFAYFAPQYFALLVGKGNTDLLLTGIFGAIKFIACAAFVFLLSEHIGRRYAFVLGAAGMAACHIITAAIVQTHPASNTSKNPVVTSYGIATVAMIYLFVIIYNMSWGPLPWPYVSEIFPARIRDPGIATGVAAQWLFNFVYTLATPYMISSAGWGTFLIWGIFNAVISLLTYLFLGETKGFSLEQINAQYEGRETLLADKVQAQGSPTLAKADHVDIA